MHAVVIVVLTTSDFYVSFLTSLKVRVVMEIR